MSWRDKIKHAWNAFKYEERVEYGNNGHFEGGYVSTSRPDRPLLSSTTERSTILPILNRLSVDVASIAIKHVRLNDQDKYLETIESELNQRFTVEANMDQTSRAFLKDVAFSMFEEGAVAIVPVETSFDPTISNSYIIHSLRVGEILEWHPNKVRVRVYNEKIGMHEDVTLPKSMVGIVENPLYEIMNEPNSTLKRLLEKLNLLDAVDIQSGSGKLDIIIQLPYIIKSEARKKQAEDRRKAIEDQLAGSKYGIAYTDGTEKVTQLNRPAENNLMGQITYLTSMLYSQLGLTENVFNGTASEEEMINYYNRTIEPAISAIVDECKRKFLTKTARTQKQTLMFFREPFKLVSVKDFAEIVDKFTRNEVASSNDMRSVIGWEPSKDPSADELRNKNIPKPEDDSNKNMKGESKDEQEV